MGSLMSVDMILIFAVKNDSNTTTADPICDLR